MIQIDPYWEQENANDIEPKILVALADMNNQAMIQYSKSFNDNYNPLSEDSIIFFNYMQNLVVYDKKNNEILWYYEDENPGPVTYFTGQNIEIRNDHLYYTTTYMNEQTFMGDTLTHPDDEWGVTWSTVFHKINWKTNTKEWSKNIVPCEVEQFRELVDGSIMLDISLHAHFIWEGVPMESSDWGSANRSKVYVKMSSNG